MGSFYSYDIVYKFFGVFLSWNELILNFGGLPFLGQKINFLFTSMVDVFGPEFSVMSVLILVSIS